jgi:hypothetical protein
VALHVTLMAVMVVVITVDYVRVTVCGFWITNRSDLYFL